MVSKNHLSFLSFPMFVSISPSPCMGSVSSHMKWYFLHHVGENFQNIWKQGLSKYYLHCCVLGDSRVLTRRIPQSCPVTGEYYSPVLAGRYPSPVLPRGNPSPASGVPQDWGTCLGLGYPTPGTRGTLLERTWNSSDLHRRRDLGPVTGYPPSQKGHGTSG